MSIFLLEFSVLGIPLLAWTLDGIVVLLLVDAQSGEKRLDQKTFKRHTPGTSGNAKEGSMTARNAEQKDAC
jgi:hypothetical protein